MENHKTFLFEIYANGYDTEWMYQEVIASSKEEARTNLLLEIPNAYIINVFVEA
jgi:hypothetical protein